MPSTVFENLKEKPLMSLLGLCILVLLFLMPRIIHRFWIGVLTEILILGLAGMSVNLLLGYGGSLPFGHAAFYAAGAYATAILLKRTAMPTVLIMLIAPLVAAALGALFGLLIARLYRFYYALMTTGFSMLLWVIIRKLPALTGGDDGITGLILPGFVTGINNAYFFTLFVVLVCIFILWLIINSPFGWTLRAIRENSNRTAFICIDVIRHRYLAFIISSFFAGVAGALFVIYSHSTFPDYAYWVKSGDMAMVCLLGGMFSFLGPMVGAAILIFLQTWITSITPYWPLVIGIIICLVVLLMPDGVLGIWRKLEPYMVKGSKGSV
ncbi:MAG: branched-chain amino acid ABC transporter permease [Candidatus Tectomicrobia bacterium]|uniref:Branched-chain amino acid ABC transporter permease n=1 Tax=Tectimicrobiota bacterium TaxID=2528274 RepID=A0A933GKH6_UNCTE|nr:branched-chain amino acid ABC transporter permease [Candidatus Tectomicrobia bacterium]